LFIEINTHFIPPIKPVSSSLDIDLVKIRSFEKKQEVYNILHSNDPCHYERLYLVGFLKHVGYTLEEICSIIDHEASWGDYDASMTYCQVRSVFRPSTKDTMGQSLFLNGFVDGVLGENTFTKVVSPIHTTDTSPKICHIGSTNITCYFKNCELCPVKSPAERGEK
jgi:hypothetical protein